jgi:hypothetical protein
MAQAVDDDPGATGASTGQKHHCVSQGTPSPSPSICTPGQCFRKYFASSQERICVHRVRPSQR